MKCSLLWEKSKFKWLKEGDSNSRFFYIYILKRSRRNDIWCLNFNGVNVEGHGNLKAEIKLHFQSHFSIKDWDRPKLGNMGIPQISAAANAELLASFSEVEIENVVWDCERSKRPEPDEENFDFIKKICETQNGFCCILGRVS